MQSENEFRIYDAYIMDKYLRELGKNILNDISSDNQKNDEHRPNTKLNNKIDNTKSDDKVDDDIQNIKREEIKPFDIETAVANAKNKQAESDIVSQSINKIMAYINNRINERSLNGYKFCFVDINDIVLDNEFNTLAICEQTHIINDAINKYTQSGYNVFMYFKSEYGKPKKRMIKISW